MEKTNNYTMATIFTSVILALFITLPSYASALTIHIPTVTVNTGSVIRNGTDDSSRVGFRGRGTESTDTSSTDDTNNSAEQGESGADGQDGESGGTVTTGDENIEISVVNNGPTDNGDNNNGGASAGSGGDGGRSGRAGSVRSGGVVTSSSSFNSSNATIHSIFPGR